MKIGDRIKLNQSELYDRNLYKYNQIHVQACYILNNELRIKLIFFSNICHSLLINLYHENR